MELKKVTMDDAEFLFNLLKQREGSVNISHKSLPTWEEHLNFIKNYDYPAWDIIIVNDKKIGNIYLTTRDEIGIFIDKEFQNCGYGSDALIAFMKKKWEKTLFG